MGGARPAPGRARQGHRRRDRSDCPAAHPHRAVIASTTAAPSEPLVASLRRLGLVGDALPPMRPLPGGVSSEVWCIELRDRRVCAKRALPRLNVVAACDAPTERTRFEAAWLD